MATEEVGFVAMVSVVVCIIGGGAGAEQAARLTGVGWICWSGVAEVGWPGVE